MGALPMTFTPGVQLKIVGGGFVKMNPDDVKKQRQIEETRAEARKQELRKLLATAYKEESKVSPNSGLSDEDADAVQSVEVDAGDDDDEDNDADTDTPEPPASAQQDDEGNPNDSIDDSDDQGEESDAGGDNSTSHDGRASQK